MSSLAKKIGVLTFHRCINYGSYWQARCLLEALQRRGHDAVLLDHDCARVNRAEWRCALQPTLPQRTRRSDLRLYAQKTRNLLRAITDLPRSARFPLDAPDQARAFDLIIVGSDEVWNMRHPWYGGRSIFYGAGLRTQRLASYAASFGNHDASDGLEAWWADLLRRFSAISVRDQNSKAMIRAELGTEPELVLDPCLQFPPAADSFAGDRHEPYVAVYGHSFPDWYARSAREWAVRRGYRLLSIGYRNHWADEQRIAAGPEEFARLIAGSVAVATNFFHGCVFALLYARPFSCAPSAYRSNKVGDLMKELGAETHLTVEGGSESHFDQLMNGSLDPAILGRISALRRQSDRYLAHVLR